MNINVEHPALERVKLARAALIQDRRFYAVLVSHVTPILSADFPTAATDGARHYFNPDYVMKLTPKQLLGLQAHESEHDARHHGTRRGGRDPEEWNICCDYSINIDLIDEGFELPEGGLIDEKYRGMSAEDIFRSRELDRQREKEADKSDDGDEDDEDDEDDQSEDGDKSGDDSKDADDDASDDDNGDDGDAGNEAGDDNGDDGDAGNEAGDDDGESGEDDDGEGKGTPKSCGDPGMCGEVLDSASDANDGDAASQEIKWERVVRQAASMAKAVGELPGHVSREIERANNPARNWRDELREFAEQGALRIETWNRPNRRFIGSGLILPSSQKDGISKAAMLIDTSGSVDHVALECVRNEAQAMLDDGIIDELVVIYGDTRVTRVDQYVSSDQIVFDPKGGGGTDMKPLFQYVADNHDDCTFIICFTDLYIGDAGEQPHCPVMFTVHGYPSDVKQLIANAPWGAPGIDVGVH